jgi:uncharacterized membrane protein
MNNITLCVVYLILDIIWIFSITPIIYKKVIEDIQGTKLKPKLIYAILCYFVLLLAIFKICIPLSKSYSKNYKWLAFSIVGFVIYSTFNLTNASIFTNYSYKMVCIDSIWGAVVFGIIGFLYNYY